MFFEIFTCIFLKYYNYGLKFGSGIQFFSETWNNMLVFFSLCRSISWVTS